MLYARLLTTSAPPLAIARSAAEKTGRPRRDTLQLDGIAQDLIHAKEPRKTTPVSGGVGGADESE